MHMSLVVSLDLWFCWFQTLFPSPSPNLTWGKAAKVSFHQSHPVFPKLNDLTNKFSIAKMQKKDILMVILKSVVAWHSPICRQDISFKLPELEVPKPDRCHENLYTDLGDKKKILEMYITSKNVPGTISWRKW
jgi:hypothetical protein